MKVLGFNRLKVECFQRFSFNCQPAPLEQGLVPPAEQTVVGTGGLCPLSYSHDLKPSSLESIRLRRRGRHNLPVPKLWKQDDATSRMNKVGAGWRGRGSRGIRGFSGTRCSMGPGELGMIVYLHISRCTRYCVTFSSPGPTEHRVPLNPRIPLCSFHVSSGTL